MSREDHGFNSPSQIWSNKCCAGRPNQLKKLQLQPTSDDGEEKGSVPSKRGRWQHAAVELVFYGKKEWEPTDEERESLELNDIHIEHILWCADQVREIVAACGANAQVVFEYQMDLSELGIDGGEHGCRADVLIIVPGEYTVVIDFKFGFKWVPAPQRNPQFQGYAWGAWNTFGGSTVWAIKLQPMLPDDMAYTEHKFSIPELEGVKDEILAINKATEDPDAPMCRGDHCGFCTAFTTGACDQWRDTYLELPRHVAIFEYMNRISKTERGWLRQKLLDAKKWAEKAISAVDAWAHENREGDSPETGMEGFEFGPGKISNEWGDPIAVKAEIRAIAKEKGKNAKLCLTSPQPAMPKSPYQVMQVLGTGKDVKDRLLPMIVSTPGKDTIKKVRGKK